MVRCGCGGTVMPTFEWTAVGDEPGCRQVAAAAAAMDPQIKLFGQTISVSPAHTGAGADAEFLNPSSAYTAPPSSQDGGDSVQQRGAESKGASESLVRALSSSRDEELLQLHVKSRECGVAPASGVPHLCDEQSEGVVSDERDSQSVGSDGSKSQKVEKVVPCPRCSSEDTKFCYYNNYNVNQPRHFCKNCQRYWTAGGTLRNVPVGAGRRKNKASGGARRENSEASSFQMELSEFSCGVRSPKLKVSHGKRVGGQGSPVRSPGSSTSLGQESGLSMSSPPYSLYQNGRQSLQSFISHGFNTSGTEANRMGSSDSASTMRGGERLAQFFPGGNGGGYDEDCRRLSLQSKQMQDAGAHTESSDTGVSGWVGNFGGRQPVQFSNGPHGYLADWDGKHHHSAVSQPFTSGAAGVTTPPAWASTPWASSHPSWTGNPHHALHGKRQNSEVVEDCYSAKRLRTEVESKREWPVLHGRTLPESDILKQLLQQPKLEHLGAACEPKHSFMSRLFNNTTGPWPVPFPVAI